MSRLDRLTKRRPRVTLAVVEGPAKDIWYEVKAGVATPVDPATAKGAKGFAPPDAADFVLMPDGTRACFYPQGQSPRPWPLAKPVVTAPGSFTRADFKNLFGKYVQNLARDALTLEDDALPVWVWVVGGLCLLALVAGAVAAYYSHEGLEVLRGFD